MSVRVNAALRIRKTKRPCIYFLSPHDHTDSNEPQLNEPLHLDT